MRFLFVAFLTLFAGSPADLRVGVDVGSDDTSQKIAEGDIDGRAVIDGANAHLEDALSRASRLHAEPPGQIRMDISLGKRSGSLRRDAE